MTKPTVLRRRMLAEAQNWRCAYCAAAMADDAAHPIAATVDHVAPRAVGVRIGPAVEDELAHGLVEFGLGGRVAVID